MSLHNYCTYVAKWTLFSLLTLTHTHSVTKWKSSEMFENTIIINNEVLQTILRIYLCVRMDCWRSNGFICKIPQKFISRSFSLLFRSLSTRSKEKLYNLILQHLKWYFSLYKFTHRFLQQEKKKKKFSILFYDCGIVEFRLRLIHYNLKLYWTKKFNTLYITLWPETCTIKRNS